MGAIGGFIGATVTDAFAGRQSLDKAKRELAIDGRAAYRDHPEAGYYLGYMGGKRALLGQCKFSGIRELPIFGP